MELRTLIFIQKLLEREVDEARRILDRDIASDTASIDMTDRSRRRWVEAVTALDDFRNQTWSNTGRREEA